MRNDPRISGERDGRASARPCFQTRGRLRTGDLWEVSRPGCNLDFMPDADNGCMSAHFRAVDGDIIYGRNRPAWIQHEDSPRMWRSDAFCQRCGAKLWTRYHPMLFLLCL
jgi:hypothetical protein